MASPSNLSRTELIATIARRIEAGHDQFGAVHQVLRAWGHDYFEPFVRLGERVQATELNLDANLTDEAIEKIGGMEQLGLEFAHAEAMRFFVRPGREVAVDSAGLDEAIRAAVRSALAYGHRAAIWANYQDEMIIERSGATPWNGVGRTPDFDAWGSWHRQAVVMTNFVPPGQLWIAGQAAGTIHVYPDEVGGGRVHVSISERAGQRVLEARMWMDISNRDPRALSHVTVMQVPS